MGRKACRERLSERADASDRLHETYGTTDYRQAERNSGPTSVSPLADVFAGKSIRIVTDKGPALAYTFKGTKRLSVTENSGGAVDAGYGALTQANVAFFSHMIPARSAATPW